MNIYVISVPFVRDFTKPHLTESKRIIIQLIDYRTLRFSIRPGNAPESDSYVSSIKRLMTNPGYVLLLVTYGLNVGVFYAISTLLVRIFIERRKQTNTKFGLLKVFSFYRCLFSKRPHKSQYLAFHLHLEAFLL